MTEEGIDARARVLLDSLLHAVGPSSYERPAAEIWRAAAGEFADVRGDALGNSFAAVNPGGSPRIALVGHIDEIGLVVKHIDSSGVLFVGEIGTWDPAVLVGQRVTVTTSAGAVPGVMGKAARHLLTEEERKRVPLVHDLWVDIGARDHADAESAVQIGDPVVMAAAPIELRGLRLASRALDNRLGALVVLEAARRAAAAGDLRAEVIAVASVREETSYAGARTAAFAADPDVAITLDVTHTDDYPNTDQARVTGSRALGSGPSISRGAAQHEGVARQLIAVAREAGIPYTLEADGTASWTDSEAVHEVRAGVPCGLVGIPLRYMHSPSETCDLRDVELAIDLVARFCRSLEPGEDWTQ
jgi:putative aminopeptidase FrvX